MAGETTLIVTTRSGVRPLGVRGEPLHNAAPQLRRVVRRRLGDAAADLLADPQLHEDGKAIDWYAGWPGAVQPLSAARCRRARRSGPGRGRAHAWPTSAAWAMRSPRRGPREDTGLVGLSLQLAARAPADSFVFLVGDRPVIVCWGYEKEAAAALLPAALPQPPLPGPGRAPRRARGADRRPPCRRCAPRRARPSPGRARCCRRCRCCSCCWAAPGCCAAACRPIRPGAGDPRGAARAAGAGARRPIRCRR